MSRPIQAQPAPHYDEESPLRLTVIIPCYNEVGMIEAVLDNVQSVGIAHEILIVDDGSTDGTREVLQRIEGEQREGVRVIYHPQNQGKGAALVTAFKAATACAVVALPAKESRMMESLSVAIWRMRLRSLSGFGVPKSIFPPNAAFKSAIALRLLPAKVCVKIVSGGIPFDWSA